jgi:hypothetical protein
MVQAVRCDLKMSQVGCCSSMRSTLAVMISDLGGGRQLARHLSTGRTGPINNPSRPDGSHHSPYQLLNGIMELQE